MRFIKKKSKKVGLPPGTLVHIGERRTEKTKISIIDYDKTHLLEKNAISVEECFPYKDKSTVTWINIDGIHQADVVEKIGKHFDLHPLVLEDIMNTGQRSKIEDFRDYIFIVLKIPYYDDKENEVKIEQVSLILGKNFVISLMEIEKDVVNPIKVRLRNEESHLRKTGADYLTYSLIDVIVDNYFGIMENIEEKIGNIEEELLSESTSKTLQAIHNIKREMIFMSKSVWPLREIINNLERGESSLIKEFTKIYFRDAYDHTIQIIESIETFRDMITGMMDIYLSSVNNKMNEIMMFLTIIGTIFIPLTFITGIYGMNFKYMPELGWFWGYPAVLLIMFGIVVLMLFFFRRKKWL